MGTDQEILTVSDSSRECRRFEKITGLKAVWVPSHKVMAVPDVRIHVAGKDEKAACRSLLEKNLRRIRDKKMREQQGRCRCCSKAKPLHLHHIAKRKSGGGSRDDREENLDLICHDCHRREHGLIRRRGRKGTRRISKEVSQDADRIP